MEATTRTQATLDFGALLDDLLVAREQLDDEGSRPSIPFDYLAVVDELHSGRIRVSGEAAAAEYREASLAQAVDNETELLSVEDDAKVQSVEDEKPLPVEPDAIAAELGLASVRVSDLGKLRRSFALKNHPDRVAPHLRPRALARMQVANGLIDEAKRRAGNSPAR